MDRDTKAVSACRLTRRFREESQSEAHAAPDNRRLSAEEMREIVEVFRILIQWYEEAL